MFSSYDFIGLGLYIEKKYLKKNFEQDEMIEDFLPIGNNLNKTYFENITECPIIISIFSNHVFFGKILSCADIIEGHDTMYPVQKINIDSLYLSKTQILNEIKKISHILKKKIKVEDIDLIFFSDD